MKDELVALKNGLEIATQELEAWVAEKENLLAKRQAWLVEMETRLAQIKGLLWFVEEKAKMPKERVESTTTSAATQVVEEHINLIAFEEDAAKVGVEAYAISFNDCKTKVA